MRSKESQKYTRIHDGESKIYPLPVILLMACCDCGLLHELYIRRVKQGIGIITYRNNRRTGQLRRWGKHPCVPRKGGKK